MSNENLVSRRGFFMKMGILFNGPCGHRLGGADCRISSLFYHARARERLSFLGATREGDRISRGRDASGYLPESLRYAHRRQDSGHSMLGAAHRRRAVPGFCG